MHAPPLATKLSEKTIDFVIIGAAKAGTTSLASWLGGHPDVCMSTPKETMYFGSPKRFSLGINYFHANFFSHYQGEALIGEATPAYSNVSRHPGTAERVFSTNPASKIIYIVRNPLKKVESTWQMYVNLSPELTEDPVDRLRGLKAREGFAAFLQEESIFEFLIDVCLYQVQLNIWSSIFPHDQIHVMFLEDLVEARDTELARLCNFLDLDVTPMLSAHLIAENTCQQRRSPRQFVQRLVNTRLQQLAPASFRRMLLSTGLFSRPQCSALKPVWPEHLLAQFKEAVEDDVHQFLISHGKSESFYTLKRAEA